ncbi:TPA: XRE family transcriptional regulator [Photobacterium damselae]
MNTIGERIKQLRIKSGVTQHELGNALGVTDVAVSRWELGFTSPRAKTMTKLAEYFNVEVDWLVSGVTYEHQKASVTIPFCVLNNGMIKHDGKSYIYVLKGHVSSCSSISNLICLSVQDQSMLPIVKEQGVIAVDSGDKNLKDGALYLYLVNGSFHVRRLFKTVNGIRAISINNEFIDEFFDYETFNKCELIGKVVWYSSAT